MCIWINFILFHVTGKVNDYDYTSPIIYKYTFLAGSIFTYPSANIIITDDMIKNKETTFQMAVIDAALPLYVHASHPAAIFINNNNSKCSRIHRYVAISNLVCLLFYDPYL